MMAHSLVQRRVRIASALVFTGLLIELFTLHWSNPLSFLLAAFVGIPLVGVGILVFLYSLVAVRE
jgi:uncharacterized membrane protein YdcZ (DUF606 family)